MSNNQYETYDMQCDTCGVYASNLLFCNDCGKHFCNGKEGEISHIVNHLEKCSHRSISFPPNNFVDEIPECEVCHSGEIQKLILIWSPSECTTICSGCVKSVEYRHAAPFRNIIEDGKILDILLPLYTEDRVQDTVEQIEANVAEIETRINYLPCIPSKFIGKFNDLLLMTYEPFGAKFFQQEIKKKTVETFMIPTEWGLRTDVASLKSVIQEIEETQISYSKLLGQYIDLDYLMEVQKLNKEFIQILGEHCYFTQTPYKGYDFMINDWVVNEDDEEYIQQGQRVTIKFFGQGSEEKFSGKVQIKNNVLTIKVYSEYDIKDFKQFMTLIRKPDYDENNKIKFQQEVGTSEDLLSAEIFKGKFVWKLKQDFQIIMIKESKRVNYNRELDALYELEQNQSDLHQTILASQSSFQLQVQNLLLNKQFTDEEIKASLIQIGKHLIKHQQFSLSSQQQEAFKAALSNRIQLICGCAGSGMTMMSVLLSKALNDLSKEKVLLATTRNGLQSVFQQLHELQINAVLVSDKVPEMDKAKSANTKNKVFKWSIANIILQKAINYHYATLTAEQHDMVRRHIQQIQLTDVTEESKQLYEQLFISELKSAQIIVSEFSESSRPEMLQINFGSVIVDNATYPFESQTAQAVCRTNSRLIMFGDLRSTNASFTIKPLIKYSQNFNMFRRLLVAGLKPAYLSLNFRSNESIFNFVNDNFLHKGYKAGIRQNVSLNIPKYCHEMLNTKNFNFVFINVTQEGTAVKAAIPEIAIDVTNVIETSYQNKLEADIVSKCCQELDRANVEDYKVLSLQRAQIDMLKKYYQIKEAQLAGNAEGLVSDAIIFTNAQSIEYESSKKIYLALTRARKLVIVIGNELQMNGIDYWNNLIAQCKSNGTYWSGKNLESLKNVCKQQEKPKKK
ncbi:DNA_helicase [Hexamita inflata]|uniref:Putative n=1 Tax=Hexamita inflata TaxID=28002 RepID=A0AA86NXD0_9EUKA|nr:DNA helicase [Hexamita inflata]